MTTTATPFERAIGALFAAGMVALFVLSLIPPANLRAAPTAPPYQSIIIAPTPALPTSLNGGTAEPPAALRAPIELPHPEQPTVTESPPANPPHDESAALEVVVPPAAITAPPSDEQVCGLHPAGGDKWVCSDDGRGWILPGIEDWMTRVTAVPPEPTAVPPAPAARTVQGCGGPRCGWHGSRSTP
jgi:hypothetical protein